VGTNAIGCIHTHLDYTTHSIDDMKRFYGEVLGFTDTAYDSRFDYLLVRTGPSASLGFMPPMPGPPEQWRPPREPAIYLHVTDVDRAYRELAARGVTFQQEPMDMPWGHRVAILRDPEGRQIFLAQQLER
jgi:predicted enzyme related to lactoylglutathione lyase